MTNAAALRTLAAFFVGAAAFALAACRSTAPAAAAGHPPSPPVYTASAFPLVGHVLAVDAARSFVIVDLTDDPPAAALRDGATLWVRARDLRLVGRLTASRQRQGDTLGTRLLAGEARIDDEVVFQAP